MDGRVKDACIDGWMMDDGWMATSAVVVVVYTEWIVVPPHAQDISASHVFHAHS